MSVIGTKFSYFFFAGGAAPVQPHEVLACRGLGVPRRGAAAVRAERAAAAGPAGAGVAHAGALLHFKKSILF